MPKVTPPDQLKIVNYILENTTNTKNELELVLTRVSKHLEIDYYSCQKMIDYLKSDNKPLTKWGPRNYIVNRNDLRKVKRRIEKDT